jgi:hypothetical protein
MTVRYSPDSSGPSTRQAGQPEVDVYDDTAELEAMTKQELQDLAEAHGLPKSGSKADLIERLRD